MSDLKEVTVSGAVGKQVFTSSQPIRLKSVILTAVSAAVVIVRDGNASGDVKLTGIGLKGDSKQFTFDKAKRFDKGMHVKVTGTNSKAYLEIE